MNRELFTEAGQFLAPYAPDDWPMAVAWLSALSWATRQDDIMRAFQHDTGATVRPLQRALDRMIDQATGADKALLEAFVVWFNANIWGE